MKKLLEVGRKQAKIVQQLPTSHTSQNSQHHSNTLANVSTIFMLSLIAIKAIHSFSQNPNNKMQYEHTHCVTHFGNCRYLHDSNNQNTTSL